MTIGFDCPHCGIADNEVEVVIDSAGSPGSYGLPEYSYPGEGAEWHVGHEGPFACHGCNEVITVEWMHEHLEDEVQKRAAEPVEPDWEDVDPRSEWEDADADS